MQVNTVNGFALRMLYMKVNHLECCRGHMRSPTPGFIIKGDREIMRGLLLPAYWYYPAQENPRRPGSYWDTRIGRQYRILGTWAYVLHKHSAHVILANGGHLLKRAWVSAVQACVPLRVPFFPWQCVFD